MYLRVARTITFVVALFMSLDIVGASVMAFSPIPGEVPTLNSRKQASSPFCSFLAEKVEEETDKFAEQEVGAPRVLLMDLSRMALSLALYYAPQADRSVLTFLHDTSPPAHKLNCVFLI